MHGSYMYLIMGTIRYYTTPLNMLGYFTSGMGVGGGEGSGDEAKLNKYFSMFRPHMKSSDWSPD